MSTPRLILRQHGRGADGLGEGNHQQQRIHALKPGRDSQTPNEYLFRYGDNIADNTAAGGRSVIFERVSKEDRNVDTLNDILGRLYVYSTAVRLEARKDSTVYLISNTTATDPRYQEDRENTGLGRDETPLQASTSDTKHLIQLRQGDSFVVVTARFSLETRDAAEVQVSSSPPPEADDITVNGNRNGIDEEESGVDRQQMDLSGPKRPGLLVERSITERAGSDGVGMGSAGALTGRGQQASTPGASLGPPDERVLDTPALDTRHKDPAQTTADSRLSSMLGPASREFASCREQLSGLAPEEDDLNEGQKDLLSPQKRGMDSASQNVADMEMEEPFVQQDSSAGLPPSSQRSQESAKVESVARRGRGKRGKRKVVESQESSAALVTSLRESNVFQSTSSNPNPNLSRGSQMISNGQDGRSDGGHAEIEQSPRTSQGSAVSLPHQSFEQSSQAKAKLPRKRKRSPVKGRVSDASSTKRRKATSSDEDGQATKVFSHDTEDATQSSVDQPTQWTLSADSVPHPSKPSTQRRPLKTYAKHHALHNQAPSPTSPPPSKIAFSNSTIPDQPKLIRFLKSHGIKVVDTISATGCDMLCVGGGELKRTSKLTLSVALGKPVVTDAWVLDSQRAGHLVDAAPYLPHDAQHEKAWGFDLAASIERGRSGVRVLRDWTVRLTPCLSKTLGVAAVKELEHMACAGAGAESVLTTTRLPRGPPDEHPRTLILANAGPEQEDGDVATLTQQGWDVYSKDLLSLSMLRGRLEVEGDEFVVGQRVDVEKAAAPGQGKNGTRKKKKGR